MRSGTTFLYNKLSEHPQLLKMKGEFNEEWTEFGGADCTVYCNHMTKADFQETYREAMSNVFAKEVRHCKGIYKHLERAKKKMQKEGGRVFYDWKNIIPMNKSTHLSNKLGYVHAMFPASKVLFIIRDIYGHSASLKVHLNNHLKKTGHYFYKPFGEMDFWTILGDKMDKRYDNQPKFPGDFSLIPEMWIRLNHLAIQELSQLPSEQVLIVNYEELTQNQPEELTRVFDFLQLEQKHKNVELKVASEQLKVINTTTKGNPLEKWKTELTPQEIRDIERVIQENQDKYNEIVQATTYS